MRVGGALSARASTSTVSPVFSRRTSSSQISPLILTRRPAMSLRTCVQLWPGSERRRIAASVLPACSAGTGKDWLVTMLMAVLLELQLPAQPRDFLKGSRRLAFGLVRALGFILGALDCLLGALDSLVGALGSFLGAFI